MKVTLLKAGKPTSTEVPSLVQEYVKRLKLLHPLELSLVKDLESPALLKKLLDPDKYLVTLDENGKQFSSRALATQMGLWLADSRIKEIVFVVGGPYGIPETILKRAKLSWSLSKLTLPSDIAWLLVTEQIYRAATILKGMSYHHD